MNIFQFNLQEITFLSIFAIAWLWQVIFIIRRIIPLTAYKPEAGNNISPPVSVVISAKNEAENLEKYLPEILTQDYPDYQVVVVNDCSEDNTELVLARLKEQYPHLYYTNISADKKFYHGKKLPLSLGIKAAKNEFLVLTDADCRPTSDQWLKNMSHALSRKGKDLVLGIGNYKKTKGFTNLWVRYDTFTIAMQYLGYALSGAPYMGTGRNMAYKKSLFNNTKGFKSHFYVPSGDDDLFVQEAATKSNITVCVGPESQTISVPPGNFKKWLRQKQRHLTTSPHYANKTKASLIMEPFTREIFWLQSIYSIFFPNFALIVLPFFFIWLIFKFIIWKLASEKTGMGKIYWALLIFDFIQPLILAYSHIGNLTGSKKRKWK